MDAPLNSNNKETGIELNYNYSSLVKTDKALLIKSYIEDTFPRVAEKLLIEGSLLPYVEPKLIKQVELECDYRFQGYPLNGVEEIAFRDISLLINSELEPFEKKEMLNLFDMDLHVYIDTETIN